ncbi:MAG: tetratricopeptide repeat protein [Dehalococcoidia bacterium]
MHRLLLGIGLVLVLAGASLGLVALLRSGSDSAGSSQTTAPSGGQSAELAVAFWRSRTESDPTDFVAYSKLGLAYARYARETGDNTAYASAQAALESSLRLRPDDIEARVALAEVMLARHEFVPALETAQLAYAADPDATAALATVGDAHLALGNYDEGLAAYEALAEVATGPAVLSRLAYVVELYGDPEEAIELMREAEAAASERSSSPERLAWYRTQLGDLLFKVGSYDEARTWYERSLEALPSYAFALGGLARVETAAGNYDGAIALYEDALSSRAEPPFHAALGDLFNALGDDAKAQEHYATARALSQYEVESGIPHIHEFVMLHAAYGVETEGSVDLALAQLAGRRDIYSYDAAAWALYHAGRYAEAAPLIEQALRLGTQDAQLLYHAGMIFRALGDEAQARTLLEQSLELSPHFSLRGRAEAQAALSELLAAVNAS